MVDFKKGRIIVFSGAGISAESGLDTFRDKNGLWANHDPMIVCNYRNWIQNYHLVHKFYNLRRKELEKAIPNPAHRIVRRLEMDFGIINITQNIDDLFEKAGCQNVLHLHGNLKQLRCEKCENIFNIDYNEYDFTPCPKCKNPLLKPNIVFFFESAPKYNEMYQIFDSITHNDIVVVIGTSGEVINICSMLNKGYKILNNLESVSGIDEKLFNKVYLESSSSALIKIYDEIKSLKL